jgi:SAM-dependent methyltransferase
VPSVGDNYILPGRSDHDRLRTISEIHDGQTHLLLRRAGFAPGLHFAEFGCGLGYVTRWAASEGAASATGYDVNEEQIQACQKLAQAAALPNARFRVANIYDPGLAPASLDIAYCRWLLVHLTRPIDALRVIYNSLKPGGVMVCEEADVSAVYAEPPSAAYNEMRELALAAGRARGVDYASGRWAHTWALQAGYQLEHAAAYHPHYLTGPHKGFWNWTLSTGTARMVEEGTLDAAHRQALINGMTEADTSPDTLVAHCRMHQIIARKPA